MSKFLNCFLILLIFIRKWLNLNLIVCLLISDLRKIREAFYLLYYHADLLLLIHFNLLKDYF